MKNTLFNFANRSTGSETWTGVLQLVKVGRSSLLPLKPKHRLGHPENYYFLLSKELFIGSKYPKNKLFDFEKNFTGVHALMVHLLLSQTSTNSGFQGCYRHVYKVPVGMVYDRKKEGTHVGQCFSF